MRYTKDAVSVDIKAKLKSLCDRLHLNIEFRISCVEIKCRYSVTVFDALDMKSSGNFFIRESCC